MLREKITLYVEDDKIVLEYAHLGGIVFLGQDKDVIAGSKLDVLVRDGDILQIEFKSASAARKVSAAKT